MRKIIAKTRPLAFIILLVLLGYMYFHNSQNSSLHIIEHYTVKTEARNAAPGEDIHVYDNSGTEILSLISADAQYLYLLTGNSLILDIGTSASQRMLAVYDIPSKLKIFESVYYPSEGNSLAIKNTTLQFYHPIWNSNTSIKKPVDAPSCSGLDNGYVETRSFDLITKKTQESGIFTCAYFE